MRVSYSGSHRNFLLNSKENKKEKFQFPIENRVQIYNLNTNVIWWKNIFESQ